jgi:hypothetical protein
MLHASPVHPLLQIHLEFTHKPLPEQSLGQEVFSQKSPKNPVLQIQEGLVLKESTEEYMFCKLLLFEIEEIWESNVAILLSIELSKDAGVLGENLLLKLA